MNALRALVVGLALTLTSALPALAQASPPDPSWIPGTCDDADFDDIVTLVVTPDAPSAAQLPVLHLEWKATPGRRGQEDISGYVYNDAENAAVSVELRITGLDASGQNVADVVRPVEGSVPGYGRAFFNVRVPRSPSYRVAVTSFDFIEPRRAM